MPDRSSRGAPSTECSASRKLPAAGLIAASGGNHGAALAYVGQQLGLRVEIFMPSTSPAIKRANIERFGADVTVIDGYYDDAQREVENRQAETGAMMVHPYDHAETVAGQGTMASELEEQVGASSTRSSSPTAGEASSPVRRRGSVIGSGSSASSPRRRSACGRHCSPVSRCR